MRLWRHMYCTHNKIAIWVPTINFCSFLIYLKYDIIICVYKLYSQAIQKFNILFGPIISVCKNV